MFETKKHKNVAKLWLPDQPGAWVMALFPTIGGIVVGGISWRNVWLAAAWTLCYCFQFSAARWLATRSHEAKDAHKSERRDSSQHTDGKAKGPSTESAAHNPPDRTITSSESSTRKPNRTNKANPITADLSAGRILQSSGPTTTRHSNIYFMPAAVYLIITAAVGIPVFVFAPKLLWWIPTYAVLAALSFWAAWKRDERTLWGNAVSVIAAGGMALLSTSLGSRFFLPPTPHERLTSRLSPILAPNSVAVTGSNNSIAATAYQSNLLSVSHRIDLTQYYFGSPLLPKAGVIAAIAFILTEYASVLFVKTMIREHGHMGYYALSIGYHILLIVLGFASPTLLLGANGLALVHSTPVSTLLWGIPAVILLLRAATFPLTHKRMKPVRIGMIEAVTSMMNLVVIALVLA